MLPSYNNKHNKVLLCLTDTSLYIYIRVKHFGMANIQIGNWSFVVFLKPSSDSTGRPE